MILTASTSEAYSWLFKLLCDAGDEVLVPQPSYPLFDYLTALESVRAVPYQLRWDGEWHLDALPVSPRTRAVLVVNPGNPTGAFLKQDEFQALARTGLPIISDEVFSDFPAGADERRVRTVAAHDDVLSFALGGLSKLAGLPQLKLGWMVASGPGSDEMLRRLEAGEQRITGLDDRQTDLTFETEFTARSNPHRGYITIIEGCDKFCAYCVVPYTRGKERSRTSASVLVEARKMVDLGYTEIQFLGQNVNSWRDPSGRMSFAELLVAVGELPGTRRVRFTTSHPRDFTRDIVEAIDTTPTLCDHVHLPVQSGSSSVLKAMAREYTREWYLERMSWIKAARRDISITSDMIVGFPGETDEDFEETITLVGEVKYDAVFAFKFSPRPNTPAVTMADSIPDAVKSERLRILMDRQREIQREHYGRHLGQVQECMVESYNPARGQVVGRSSQNKTVNFTTAQLAQARPPVGSYVPVRITQTLPNCLVGEAMTDSAEGAAFVPVARVPQLVVLN